MNNYLISRQAHLDLGNIYQYTLYRWSGEQAKSYYETLIATIELISSNKLKGKLIHQKNRNIFSLKINSHFIIYSYNDKENLVIVRVLHVKMDLPNRLNF